MRPALLRTALFLLAAAYLATELLSIFHALRPLPIALFWAAAALAVLLLRPLPQPRLERPSLATALALAPLPLLLGGTLLTALLSPPNSADALSYHLPRVLYWVQNHSVAFFPTGYLNQIMLQPAAEYFTLHLWLLSGGDSLANLPTWAGYAASLLALSALAAELRLAPLYQALAALFAATLPNAVLQASGAKNDTLLALFLLSAALFTLRWAHHGRPADLATLALSAALALATKGTAYLFLPPTLAAAWLAAPHRRPPWRALAAVAAATLLLNGPQYLRNLHLSGSPLGFDSAQADGAFRWRNEPPSPAAAASNLIRHTSEQLGARSPAWNHGVYDLALHLHTLLGLDPNDPATTWRWSRFAPPRKSNHEADANNRWHLALLLAALLPALFHPVWRAWALAPAGGLLLFCAYLKWQPFSQRLELPLFFLAAPLAAYAATRIRPHCLLLAPALFLLTTARLPLIANWTRPLTGPRSILTAPRDQVLFYDTAQWNNRDSYLAAAERTLASGCPLIGTDLSFNHVEYPYLALLRARRPDLRFTHSGVANPSAAYPALGPPCAVLCLDCADAVPPGPRYGIERPPERYGRFLLYLSGQ